MVRLRVLRGAVQSDGLNALIPPPDLPLCDTCCGVQQRKWVYWSVWSPCDHAALLRILTPQGLWSALSASRTRLPPTFRTPWSAVSDSMTRSNSLGTC